MIALGVEENGDTQEMSAFLCLTVAPWELYRFCLDYPQLNKRNKITKFDR